VRHGLSVGVTEAGDPRRLRIHDGEAEKLLKRIEVAVGMEQGMLFAQTECCDQAIDRSPYGAPPRSQESIVSRGEDRQVESAGRVDLELVQRGEDPGRIFLRSQALEDITDREVDEPEPLAGRFAVEPRICGMTTPFR
jgi:hypothetical protein